MNYILTLITKKSEAEPKAIGEIKDFLKEKKGQLVETNKLNDLPLGSVFKLEVSVDPQEVGKLKKKIKGEEVISFLLEKKREIKKIKKESKKIKEIKPKAKPNKTKKVLASMREEEKKIKDLDSTLDKILNE